MDTLLKSMHTPTASTTHETVLLEEAVEALSIEPGDVIVDATIGGAGHFKAIYQALGTEGMVIGIDADEEAISRAQAVVAEKKTGPQVRLIEGNFRNIGAMLDDAGVETIDGILFDLGWSAFHLSRGRGFSFQNDEPLLMTYGNPERGTTATDILNGASEEVLSDMLFTLGEERFARQIAQAIVARREVKPVEHTSDLVEIVKEATPAWYHHRRINPATKTFQALRIAVNDELGAIRDALGGAIARLAPQGRLAVITFHSIEDRIVKNILRDTAHTGKGTLIARKPLAPTPGECARNPRARSAKLRVFEMA